jgi:hypothetical protein
LKVYFEIKSSKRFEFKKNSVIISKYIYMTKCIKYSKLTEKL